MQRETVLEDLREGVLLLTMNRPRQRNAFNLRMWRDMRDALAEAHANDEVRCVVVTGAEGAFTAGADLGDMSGRNPRESGGENAFGEFLDRLFGFDKPLVAAVNGVAVGIGFTMLLHCDYVYIARGARLRAPFVTLGVVPEAAASYMLPLIVGWRAATDLLFESDFVDAERAQALGLATHLCEPGEVLPAALERARAIARKPLGSLRHTKRLLLASRTEAVRAAQEREDAIFRVRIGSPENAEAIRAFFEKRPPDFSAVPPHDVD